MPKYVIDTNVAVIANGLDEGISSDCKIKAIKLLQDAVGNGIIYLDDEGRMQGEYRNYLNPRGQPGVGDRFFLEVINSHPDKVVRVELRKGEDGEYLDLPKPVIDAGFDPSDRVFAALAKKVRSKIYNAVDTDWLEHREVIEENGIRIVFICGCDPERWRD